MFKPVIELIKDIFIFGYTVMSYWQGYITGGVVVAGMWLYERLTNNNLSNRFIIVGVIVFLLTSFFMAWRDEHHALLNIKNTLEINKPKFEFESNQMINGESSEIKGLSIFINLTIKNLGTQSVVRGWKLIINSKDVKLPIIQPTKISDGFQIRGTDNKVIAQFQQNNILIEKAMNPIPQGSLVGGWLRFDVPGITMTQFNDAIKIISVEDIYGNEYSTTLKFEGIQENPLYYPDSGNDPFYR